MTTHRSIVIICLLFLFPFIAFTQDIQTLDLGGKWKFRKAGGNEWKDAIVPGCVHLDLLRNKSIPDPFYRDNESSLQWIGEIGWEYLKTFTISDTVLQHIHVDLDCKGLDTYANVFINDSLVIVADNMFREWAAPIKKYIHTGENTIRIQFPAIVPENSSRYSQLPYKLPGDEKVICRKAAYHFGWDWGPVFITSGIWKPIQLRVYDDNIMLGVHYLQNFLSDSLARLTGRYMIFSVTEDTASVKIFVNGEENTVKSTLLRKGVNIIPVNFTIKNPKRWWTNGMGDPYLYNISHDIYIKNQKLNSGSTRIGLRTLMLVEQPDSAGHSFYFLLNGVPVFMKGANYIPPDNFLPRVTDSTYQALIKSAKDANMNMLRVWGGGTYEKDLFYDLCDENGILVWQDFMFACAMYPSSKTFLQNVTTEVIQNIVRLRNHPCLALWCGNNEIDEGWKNWGWQKQYNYSTEDSAAIWHGYDTLFHKILRNCVLKFDGQHPYISTSPRNGWGRTESLREGDMHYWGVWWGKETFDVYKRKIGRFVSEYGFQGFPDMKSIRLFTLPEDRILFSPVMKAHQKHPIGYETIEEYMVRDFHKPENFESYGYVSQLLQVEGIGIAMEAHRRAKPYCMGTLFWQLNDCWPVVSWSCRDYYGQPKALYYEARKDYQNVMISVVNEKGAASVYVVSDSISEIPSQLSVKVLDFNGKILSDSLINLTIPLNSSTRFFEMPLNKLLGENNQDRVFLHAELTAGKKLLADRNFYFVTPKFLKLEKPVITASVTQNAEGYSVKLTTDKLARNVYLSVPGQGQFSDNYFDLIPGMTKTVYFQTTKHFHGFKQQLKITSLFENE
ncbi:MAG: glycoside hydrolase family 2 protein [Bacteroidota bacterium]|nr:glycoside hydrolase family 2 protein [Bacteroidota bacterium]